MILYKLYSINIYVTRRSWEPTRCIFINFNLVLRSCMYIYLYGTSRFDREPTDACRSVHRGVVAVVQLCDLPILLGKHCRFAADGKTEIDKNAAKPDWQFAAHWHRGYPVQQGLFSGERTRGDVTTISFWSFTISYVETHSMFSMYRIDPQVNCLYCSSERRIRMPSNCTIRKWGWRTKGLGM